MPKVEYTATKGLFQTSGNGIELTQGTAAVTLNMKVYEEEKAFAAATETVLTANQIPAGALVLGGKLEVLTANTNAVNITDVGTSDEDNDDDKYSGTISLAANAVGSVALSPSALIPNAAAGTVAITHGSAAADGKFRVTLYYLSLS